MAIETRAAINNLRHDNHVPPATITERTFTQGQSTTYLLISNVSAVTVWVSFDGIHFLSIASGGVFISNFSKVNSYWTKGDAVAAVEVIIGSES